jgi:hypothetical protein
MLTDSSQAKTGSTRFLLVRYRPAEPLLSQDQLPFLVSFLGLFSCWRRLTSALSNSSSTSLCLHFLAWLGVHGTPVPSPAFHIGSSKQAWIHHGQLLRVVRHNICCCPCKSDCCPNVDLGLIYCTILHSRTALPEEHTSRSTKQPESRVRLGLLCIGEMR